MANAPDLSLRGAKRRGNLAVLCWISRKLRRKRNCFPEIAPQGYFLALRAQGATAPSGPRNDKSGSIAPLNSCHQYCQPAWRSLSAATDAIGRCVFIDTLHELEVPSRDCHVALLLAMTHQAGAAAHQCPSAVELPCTRRSLSAAAFFSRTADLYGSPQPTEKYPNLAIRARTVHFYATRICHSSQLVKHYFFEKGIDLFLICVMLFL